MEVQGEETMGRKGIGDANLWGASCLSMFGTCLGICVVSVILTGTTKIIQYISIYSKNL
ncbi:hypothetical protein PM082_004305 [Marasmius tenuissimus]|nr:hypothetical protein PM082_004305 [Marasmius tenuissimus]